MDRLVMASVKRLHIKLIDERRPYYRTLTASIQGGLSWRDNRQIRLYRLVATHLLSVVVEKVITHDRVTKGILASIS